MRSIILLIAVTMASSERFWFFGHQYSRTLLGDNIDRASMKMLKEAYLSSDDSNVVTSPLGVILLLSLYSSGATGKSRDEISALLGASAYTELHDSYGRVSNEFASMDSNFLVLANKVCVADGYTITEEFSNTAQYYNSEVDVIDFSDSKSAAEIINQWADQKSKGYIRNPVSEDLFNEEIAVALFNVIFFQGHWHVPFQAWRTEEKDFHVNRSLTVKKPMMHLQQSLFYHENNDLAVKMIELPYQEDGFRMVVILPNEVDGLSSIIEKVADIGILADVFALRPVGKEINLYMPKFDIKSKLDYAEILPKLGVNGIFEEGALGIVKERDVIISKIFQEAFVKVDEEGATAGAFTGAIAIPMSSNSKPPEPMDFIVDHPFLFAILHKDIILFTGIYTH